MSGWLDQFECLDIIGNGSFGVIRKVRRKADNQVFARKDLDFSRMTERDRRQIVSEVNILKDLHNPHIVRYHDRHVDRDAGVLYILMEYCGGGDLSAIIKRHARDAERAGQGPQARGLEEDKVWAFLMQILRALVYCHHPNSSSVNGSGHGRSNSLGGAEGEAKRPPILHRDLKPDNVFLDEQHNVKLGDFGLSKALQQAAFANTYVGTPYYMSPEVMQEKAYDSKSDIWSLGCLVYELCALKPPFHEAKTHAELSAFIRNGRIPPLPRGYSSGLSATIKAMLNLNPAMRPSAQQLLQHERIDYAAKVDETEKLIANVKAHKGAVAQRERDVVAREQALQQSEADVRALQQALQETQRALAAAQQDISRLQALLAAAQSAPAPVAMDEAAVEARVRAAVSARENELRAAVRRHEEGVRAAMAAREAELLGAVRAREEELQAAWTAHEAGVRAAHERELGVTRAEAERARGAREQEVRAAWEAREGEVVREWEAREAEVRREVEAREQEVEQCWREREEEIEREWEARVAAAVAEAKKGSTKSFKPPLEEVQNVLDTSTSTDTSATTTDDESDTSEEPTPVRSIPPIFQTPANAGRSAARRPHFQTPLPALTHNLRAAAPPPSPDALEFPPALITGVPRVEAGALGRAEGGAGGVPGSAMRGVVLTATGEALATPSPAEFVRMFARPLRGVALDFGRVFDGGAGADVYGADANGAGDTDVDEADTTATDATPVAGSRLSVPVENGFPPKSPGGRMRTGLASAAPISPTKSASGVRSARPASPTKRGTAANGGPPAVRRTASTVALKKTTSAQGTSRAPAVNGATRMGRPSIAQNVPVKAEDTLPAGPSKSATTSTSTSVSTSTSTSNSSSGSDITVKKSAGGTGKMASAPRKLARAATVGNLAPAAEYDLDDEENLPSPFLRKIDRERFAQAQAPAAVRTKSASTTATLARGPAMATRSKSAAVPSVNATASTAARRTSNAGNLLRAVAVANAAAAAPGKAEAEEAGAPDRPAIASARRATEMARQRLKA